MVRRPHCRPFRPGHARAAWSPEGPRQRTAKPLTRRARVRGWEWAAMRGDPPERSARGSRASDRSPQGRDKRSLARCAARERGPEGMRPNEHGHRCRTVETRAAWAAEGAGAEEGRRSRRGARRAMRAVRSEGERRRWRCRGVRPKRKGRAGDGPAETEDGAGQPDAIGGGPVGSLGCRSTGSTGCPEHRSGPWRSSSAPAATAPASSPAPHCPRVQIRPAIPHPVAEVVEGGPLAAHAERIPGSGASRPVRRSKTAEHRLRSARGAGTLIWGACRLAQSELKLIRRKRR